ncbi:MAG: c-type cytochrome [Pedosphaera sp.]|nr:c-type cytochrome [Pedosphaera sp.]
MIPPICTGVMTMLLLLPSMEAASLISAGTARIDISPTNELRLMGYASRKTESAGVALPIHARALALGDGTNAAVLITADNCILPGAVSLEIRRRLGGRAGIAPERIAITVTHTHSAPCLEGAAPNIFAMDIPADHQVRIEEYTRFFIDHLVTVAEQALGNRRASELTWGKSLATFAKNRRTPGGPVDHEVPLLRVSDPDGTVRAVFLNYACHCTTLGGEFNQVHGDWAAVAARQFEEEHPGSVALVAIGCGADANPDPRGTVELVNRHGGEIANEASRLAAQRLTLLTNPPACRWKQIELPYQTHFTRAQWESRATNSGIVGYHARRWLARLDSGQPPRPTLSYPVQTWTFGEQLALVFLGGEVVVDYSLRLKEELDAARMWVNGYANEVPCYIPSRRILREGGYEAESSLWYYDRPQQLSPDIEDLIVETVKELVPSTFRSDRRMTEFPPPKSPTEARDSLRVSPGLIAVLAASEPLIESPVAIDFGADGSLWVAEMRDYPLGMDGSGKPGGRIKKLFDTDGDGQFDRAEIWAEGLPYPTGLMAWGDGVLVCAAPEVLWVRPNGHRPSDPTGDPAIAKFSPTSEVLLSGFATHNFQARVNGLRWGLDGWVHASGGLFGGAIRIHRTDRTVECTGRDFRFKPDTGEFEALAGVGQQGRVRDDFDQWFGNDNSTLLWHYPIPDAAAGFTPVLAPPPLRHGVSVDDDPHRVFPASRTLTRFNDFSQANRLTSGCGPEIFRSTALGDEYAGNAFVCEPVHNLIRRAVLTPNGVTFKARRAKGEEHTEFVASTDNWFRPVEVRTGPDGALWIVDFYRFVVEHPRWIPPERLRELDVRSGADRGRIYRIVRSDASLRPLRNITNLSTEKLIRILDTDTGSERDLIHRELLGRALPALERVRIDSLQDLATQSPRAATRAQVLSLLAQLNQLPPTLLQAALQDVDPQVRRYALTLVAPAVGNGDWRPVLSALSTDPDIGVRYQLALTAVRFADPEVQSMALRVPVADLANPWMRYAITLSFGRASPDAVMSVLSGDRVQEGRGELFAAAVKVCGQSTNQVLFRRLTRSLSEETGQETLGQRLQLVETARSNPELIRTNLAMFRSLEEATRPQAVAALQSDQQDLPTRKAALLLLAGEVDGSGEGLGKLAQFLETPLPPALQSELLRILGSFDVAEVADYLLRQWETVPPLQRFQRTALLTSRESWVGKLLDALQREVIHPADLSPRDRQQLRDHTNAELRAKAVQLLPIPASRTAVLERFRGVADISGRSEKGGGEYDRLCASCHRLRGHGIEVGPDISIYRTKLVSDFLVAILDPSAAIEPRFLGQTAEHRDGRILAGIIRDETATTVTLVQPGGQTDVLMRADIRRFTPMLASLMPEGLEQSLEPQDLADLWAWIQRTPALFGTTGVAEGLTNQGRFTTQGASRISQLQATETLLPYPSWLSSLPMYYCRQSDGRSQVRWRARPISGSAPDGFRRFRFAVGMGFLSQPTGGFALVLNGRSPLKIDVVLEDVEWTAKDGRLRVRYTPEQQNEEDTCGVLEVECEPAMLDSADSWGHFEITGSAAASQRWFGLYAVPGRVE